MRRSTAIAFVAALLILSFNVWNVGIASGFIDPVTKLGAQDEAVYTREAIHMATGGGWLTQVYLGRYILFKPPLLVWLAGLSMKVFGVSPFAARLPALLAGALACAVVFAVVRRSEPTVTAIGAVLLLISNQLFHTLSRLNMTDMLLCACVAVAFGAVAVDPCLRTRRCFWVFSITVGAAMLTKSVAGLLPLAALLLWRLVGLEGDRPSLRRIAEAARIAFAIVLPWHGYQIVVHRDWFLAEYFGVQLGVFGRNPPQTSDERQVGFYLARLVWGDPELSLLALTALPSFALSSWKRLNPLATLLGCWLLVFGASLLIFQYRSAQYLVPLLPPLAMVCALYSPVFSRRNSAIALAILIAALSVKAAMPDRAWGLAYRSGNTLASAAPLRGYCSQQRPAELIILFPDDEFYSSVLPLNRVRYSWMDADNSGFAREPHLHYLGITLTPEEFSKLPGTERIYHERLQAWGLDSTDPIGTSIIARDVEQMRRMILDRPGSDFYVPQSLLNNLDVSATHEVIAATPDRVWLLSRKPAAQPASEARTWTCGM